MLLQLHHLSQTLLPPPRSPVPTTGLDRRGLFNAVFENDAATRNGDDSIPQELGVLEDELALLSDRMFPEETDKIERYVGGMPDPFTQGNRYEGTKTRCPSVTSTSRLVHKVHYTAWQLGHWQGMPLQEQLPPVDRPRIRDMVAGDVTSFWHILRLGDGEETSSKKKPTMERGGTGSSKISQEVFPEDLPSLPLPDMWIFLSILVTWCLHRSREDISKMPSELDMDIRIPSHAFGLTYALLSCKRHEEHLKILLELLKNEELYSQDRNSFKRHWDLPKTPTESAPNSGLPEGSEDFNRFYMRCSRGLFGRVLMHKEKWEANVVADAIERERTGTPLRVRALVMDYWLGSS
ncbi:hypothetical protein Tco_0561403 [Tanacetum coccineum]